MEVSRVDVEEVVGEPEPSAGVEDGRSLDITF